MQRARLTIYNRVIMHRAQRDIGLFNVFFFLLFVFCILTMNILYVLCQGSWQRNLEHWIIENVINIRFHCDLKSCPGAHGYICYSWLCFIKFSLFFIRRYRRCTNCSLLQIIEHRESVTRSHSFSIERKYKNVLRRIRPPASITALKARW